jgi:hypothetical protein
MAPDADGTALVLDDVCGIAVGIMMCGCGFMYIDDEGPCPEPPGREEGCRYMCGWATCGQGGQMSL